MIANLQFTIIIRKRYIKKLIEFHAVNIMQSVSFICNIPLARSTN